MQRTPAGAWLRAEESKSAPPCRLGLGSDKLQLLHMTHRARKFHRNQWIQYTLPCEDQHPLH